MGWTIPHAKTMFNAYFNAYPEIKAFQDTATHVYSERGVVKTILGRRCRLANGKAYQATSRIIQGSNADILKWKLRHACEMVEGMDGDLRMVLTVHDSFNWLGRKGARAERRVRELVNSIVDVQSPPFNLRVPFALDIKRGSTWSEATFGPKVKFDESMALAA
jgi:DNA polymerase I